MFHEDKETVRGLSDLTPILFGASAFQYLFAACDLGLFNLLYSRKGLTKSEIGKELNLMPRALNILLLGVHALKLVKVTDQVYRNSEAIEKLFESDQWNLFKDVVDFEHHVVYAGLVDFNESLKQNRNVGLRHTKGQGRDLYHRFSENPALGEVFYRYMHSWSDISNPVLVKNFDFKKVKRLIDAGGGTGVNSIAIAKAYPHLHITILEIENTVPITRKVISDAGLSDRIKVEACDMFHQNFPKGHDGVLFAHQLVIWTPEENQILMRKAYDALDSGGKIVIFSSISNDSEDGPLMAALDSVYFAAIPAEGGMIYPFKDYESWLKNCGFKHIDAINCHGWTPHGIVTAVKP